jgi:hypothetical protein
MRIDDERCADRDGKFAAVGVDIFNANKKDLHLAFPLLQGIYPEHFRLQYNVPEFDRAPETELHNSWRVLPMQKFRCATEDGSEKYEV